MSRHKHEARDLAAMLRRMMRALVRRAGEGDDRSLVELVALQAELAEAITAAGAALYARGDMSWTDIAGELGVSRQAARQRFLPAVQALQAPKPDVEPAAQRPAGAGLPARMDSLMISGAEFLVTA